MASFINKCNPSPKQIHFRIFHRQAVNIFKKSWLVDIVVASEDEEFGVAHRDEEVPVGYQRLAAQGSQSVVEEADGEGVGFILL